MDPSAFVVDAAKDWEASVHGLTLTVSREHAWERGRYHTMWISQVDEVPGAFIGYAAYEGMPGTGQLNFEPKGVNGHTVRHEIGHVMRLKHQPCGVMAEKCERCPEFGPDVQWWDCGICSVGPIPLCSSCWRDASDRCAERCGVPS